MQAPPGFAWRHSGADTALVREDVGEELADLLRQMMRGGLEATLPGGRGAAAAAALADGTEVVLRRNRRGGLPAAFLEDVYFGVRPRPFLEVAVSLQLRQRGVRVPEPLGALVQRRGPLAYRGGVATRRIARSRNAWEYLRRLESRAERRRVCAALVGAAERLLDAGAIHPDLNLTNFLVQDGEGACDVWIIDCDKVRFGRITPSCRARVWHRLQRSARRLDPRAEIVDPDWLQPLSCISPT